LRGTKPAMFSFLGLVRKHCEKYAIDTGLDFFFSCFYFIFGCVVCKTKRKQGTSVGRFGLLKFLFL